MANMKLCQIGTTCTYHIQNKMQPLQVDFTSVSFSHVHLYKTKPQSNMFSYRLDMKRKIVMVSFIFKYLWGTWILRWWGLLIRRTSRGSWEDYGEGYTVEDYADWGLMGSFHSFYATWVVQSNGTGQRASFNISCSPLVFLKNYFHISSWKGWAPPNMVCSFSLLTNHSNCGLIIFLFIPA